MSGYMKMISKGAKVAGGALKAYADKDDSGKSGTADFQKVMQKFRPKRAAKPASGKYDDIG